MLLPSSRPTHDLSLPLLFSLRAYLHIADYVIPMSSSSLSGSRDTAALSMVGTSLPSPLQLMHVTCPIPSQSGHDCIAPFRTARIVIVPQPKHVAQVKCPEPTQYGHCAGMTTRLSLSGEP